MNIQVIEITLFAIIIVLMVKLILQGQHSFMPAIHEVVNRNPKLNEPETYYHICGIIDGDDEPSHLLFTKREIEKALYRAEQNPEDVNP
jgi:hypothetical protein